MASKYMGAKMLQKQVEKEKAKKEKMRLKGVVHGNKGEFLDRKKQRFELTGSSVMNEADFDDAKEKIDENPIFTKQYDILRRNDDFFLTMNVNLINDKHEPDSEDEMG